MKAQRPTVNFVGCGRLGQVLGRLWTDAGLVQIQDVHTRSKASAQAAVTQMGAGQPQADLALMQPADIWCFAVTDGQIATMAKRLAELTQAPSVVPGMAAQPPIAVHFSGALASAELAPLTALGWGTASCHPILSFAQFDRAVGQFAGTFCALQGDSPAVGQINRWMTALGGQCFEVEESQKLLYHAAAVFSSNFLPVLQHTAQQLWLASGVPPKVVERLWPQMLKNVADNVLALGPAAALTGPAARGDVALIHRQQQALLAWDSTTAQAYDALSQLAMALSSSSKATLTSG